MVQANRLRWVTFYSTTDKKTIFGNPKTLKDRMQVSEPAWIDADKITSMEPGEHGNALVAFNDGTEHQAGITCEALLDLITPAPIVDAGTGERLAVNKDAGA